MTDPVYPMTENTFFAKAILWSANIFNLIKAKILSSGKFLAIWSWPKFCRLVSFYQFSQGQNFVVW